MAEHKNDSFRDLNIKNKTGTVVGIALLIIVLVGFLFGFYFFGIAGVFKALGVQYTSGWSLVVFVVSFIILGIIVELFFNAFFKLSVQHITGKAKLFFIRISFEGMSKFLVLFIVDEFMNSITLSVRTEILIALVFAVLETVFDDKD
ncbi:YrvL family regulatory protein [Bacillus sp. JJ1521]|uniref:YrvL family regulatory protein n=1 Tax=Bacillus sp. JJ1521 TaxID=3122957 RepID=UPI002FFE5E89